MKENRWQAPPPNFDRPPPHPSQFERPPSYPPRHHQHQQQQQQQYRGPVPPPYQSGDIVSGVVTRIESYGVFVALDPTNNIEQQQQHNRRQYKGLVHVSALRPPDQGRVEHPSEIVKMDQRLTVLVLEIIPPDENNTGMMPPMRGGAPQYKIRLSLAAIDDNTGKVREGYVMPPPRGNTTGREQDYGTGDAGYYGAGGGGDGGGLGGGGGNNMRNKGEWLIQRAEERRKLRLEQDGMNDGGRQIHEGEDGSAWKISVAQMRSYHRGHLPPSFLVWDMPHEEIDETKGGQDEGDFDDFGRKRKPQEEKKEDKQGGSKQREKERRRRRSPSSDSSSSSSSSSSGSSSSSSGSSSSDSSSSSSEDDRRKRKRRASSRRSSRKGDKRSSRRTKRSRRKYSSSSSSSSGSSSDSDSDSSGSESHARKRNRGKEKKSDKPSKGMDESDNKSSDDKREPKLDEEPTSVAPLKAAEPVDNEAPMDDDDLREAQDFKKAVQGKTHADGSDSDSDDEAGPQPLVQRKSDAATDSSKAAASKAYGGALLPGEGEALAQFVQQNLRIPRRGEIGYSSGDIDQFEKSGFVMSGSRHARMNAVRIRKENQIYSAEEQRALALITLEENQQKEQSLLQDFRTMLKDKLKESGDREAGGNEGKTEGGDGAA